MTAIPAGWPCATLSDTPPSVADRLSAPTADDILPQVLQLTPRGPAWGTDEAGPGTGANPVMLQFWRAIADHAAANYRIESDLASQCFPSAITWSLPDWEDEYGLPDTCFSGASGTAARVSAVRARFGALGGQSPAYFVCLAKSIGYDITIVEPTQFLCDVSPCGADPIEEDWFVVGADSLQETWFTCDESECDGDPLESWALPGAVAGGNGCAAESLQETWFTCDDGECDGDPLESFALAVDTDPDNSTRLESFAMLPDGDPGDVDDQVSDETTWKYWIVKVGALGDTWFTIDDGECDWDPLEGFHTAQDLECEFRRLCPPHTVVVFDYSALT